MKKVKELYNKYGAPLLAAAALVVILLTLFAGGMKGLSDNGDFGRILNAQNLERIVTDKAFVFVPEYRVSLSGDSVPAKLADLIFSVEGLGAYPSIHQAFVRVAVVVSFGVNELLGRGPIFSLAYLGVLYSIMYALLLWAVFSAFRLKKAWLDAAVKALMIVVLCDVGYTSYFNSLYSEPVQMLALLAMAATLIRVFRKRRPLKWYVLFCVSALMFGWAKFANIPAALLFIALTAVPLWRGCLHDHRRGVAVAAASSCAVLLVIVLLIPGWMSFETNYNAVFYGVLKDCGEGKTEEYLIDLGLPVDYTELAGTHYYVSRVSDITNSDEFHETFKVGKLDVAKFYLKHPAYFAQKLHTAVQSAGFIRPYYLSNYDSSHPRLTLTHCFSLWSDLRAQLPFDGVLFSLMVLGIALACVFVLFGRIKRSARYPVFLSVMTVLLLLYALASPIISNGEADLAKHMFTFAELIDALCLFNIACTAYFISDLHYHGVEPAFAVGIAVILLLHIPARAALSFAVSRLPHDELEAGSYVSLGSADGGSIIWRVAQCNEHTAVLVAADSVFDSAFSEDNSNLWSASALRDRLNGEFYETVFTEAEKALIQPQHNRVLLSEVNEKLTVDGDSDFYAFHTPALAARGESDAIAMYTEDNVFLPDIALACALETGGYGLGPCWLETPYYANGEMLRIDAEDGYIYMRDADELYPVVPCVCIPADTELTGSGSLTKPFVPVS